MEALLRLPRVQRDCGRLAALSRGECRANLRMQAISPGGLNQDVSTMRIARLRDGVVDREASLRRECEGRSHADSYNHQIGSDDFAVLKMQMIGVDP